MIKLRIENFNVGAKNIADEIETILDQREKETDQRERIRLMFKAIRICGEAQISYINSQLRLYEKEMRPCDNGGLNSNFFVVGKNSKPKPCFQCKHFIAEKPLLKSQGYTMACTDCGLSTSLITGETLDISIARIKCGEDGLFWEPIKEDE